MEITVKKLSRPMDCMECGKVNQMYGLTRNGVSVYRVVCKTCMGLYVKGLSDFLNGKVTESDSQDKEANNE